MVPNRPIVTLDIGHRESCTVVNLELDKAIMFKVKSISNVQRLLASVQGAMTLDVASSSIDYVGHGYTGISVVGIIVHDR